MPLFLYQRLGLRLGLLFVCFWRMSNPLPPVVIDLPDFISEEQELRFKIDANAYVVRFSEATVDEVFAMIANEPVPEGQDGAIKRQRAIVSRFLCKHVAEGDASQLAKDLEMLPYTHESKQSVSAHYQRIQLRVKKN